jgi:hypothetical protein
LRPERLAQASAFHQYGDRLPQFEAVKAEVEVLKAKQEMTKAKNVVRVRLVGLDTLTAGALGPRYKVQGDFRLLRDRLDPEQMAMRDLSQHPILKRQGKLVEQAELPSQGGRAVCRNVTLFGGYARKQDAEGGRGRELPTPAGICSRALRRRSVLNEKGERFGPGTTLRAINQHAREAETAQDQILVYEEGLLKQAQEALRIAQLSFRQECLQPPGCPRCQPSNANHRGLQPGALRTLPGAHGLSAPWAVTLNAKRASEAAWSFLLADVRIDASVMRAREAV